MARVENSRGGRGKARCGIVGTKVVPHTSSSIRMATCLAKKMVEYHLGTWSSETTVCREISCRSPGEEEPDCLSGGEKELHFKNVRDIVFASPVSLPSWTLKLKLKRQFERKIRKFPTM